MANVENPYTPDIAYEYIDNAFAELPDYVRPMSENYSEIMLGGKTVPYDGENIIWIDTYDKLEETVDNFVLDDNL